MTAAEVAERLPINWGLLKNPVNWVIIFLMVAIGGAGLAIIINATAPNEGLDNGQ